MGVDFVALRELNRRIDDLASRRQRLWANPRRLTNDRLLDLTRELNGHASDLDPSEPPRHLRGAAGLYWRKRQLLAEQS